LVQDGSNNVQATGHVHAYFYDCENKPTAFAESRSLPLQLLP
jgi:hypothetical protein